jgi:hypothetical protein
VGLNVSFLILPNMSLAMETNEGVLVARSNDDLRETTMRHLP